MISDLRALPFSGHSSGICASSIFGLLPPLLLLLHVTLRISPATPAHSAVVKFDIGIFCPLDHLQSTAANEFNLAVTFLTSVFCHNLCS
jgi:hypothetical protein